VLLYPVIKITGKLSRYIFNSLKIESNLEMKLLILAPNYITSKQDANSLFVVELEIKCLLCAFPRNNWCDWHENV